MMYPQAHCHAAATFVVCALAFTPAAQAPARIHTAGKLVVAPGTVLVGDQARLAIEDGRVVGIGPQIPQSFTARAKLVDHGDSWLAPGFILAHTTLGQDRQLAETIDAYTPDLVASDGFDAHTDRLPAMLNGGVTSFGLAPASRNTFAGLGRVVRYDRTERRGTVPAYGSTYLKLALVRESLLRDRYPTSRMGAVDLIRQQFRATQFALQPGSGVFQDTDGDGTPETPKDLAILASALNGATTVIHATTHAGIKSSIDLADEFGLQVLLLGADNIDETIYRLPNPNVCGIIFDELSFGASQERLELPARVAAKGVPIAFTAASPAALRRTAALAVRHGLPRRVALEALTVAAAKMLGPDVEKEIGSLRNGKRADFVVWSGDPIDLTSRASAVYVDGLAQDALATRDLPSRAIMEGAPR